MSRELLFSLTKKDFVLEFYVASGHGGQNLQKNSTACRITHPASGAVSTCQEERSQLQNKKKAFKRLIEKPEFKKWHRMMVAKALGQYIDDEKWVEQQMEIKNLRFEVKINGKWVRVNPNEIKIDYDKLDD